MGWYSENVVPRITNVACGSKRMSPMRERAASGLSGDVVEVGFGTGLNVPFYPSAVARVIAIEPSEVSKRLASARVSASRVPIDFIGLDGAQLPLEDESADHVLSTWTLCTIPEVDAALGEVKRVLRPGGAFHFVEHGRSPDEKVARSQDRWTPLNMRLGGGCHLNRPILDLLNASGLEVTKIERYYVKGPKKLGYMYEGIAQKA
ncbi:MAG TPA: methyltransferase domain-containing protein [Acidimicrobiales bacterium]|nr:methyltransferase domain-containing protein [Acidimicrobiales bacterium]